MDTPKTLPLNLLCQLFAPLCNNICCSLFVVEILRDDSGNLRGFTGRVANRLFYELLSVSEDDILGKELPESLSQTLALSALMRELTTSGATQIRRDLSLAPGRPYFLQAHLICPELMTITIQIAQPEETTVSDQAEIILASLGDPCTIINRNFSIIYENEAAKKIWGTNYGKKCHTIYHGLQNRCESCHVDEVFADGMIHKNEKIAYLKGGERHMEITSAPLKDATGKITSVVNITHDVTLRKLTEKGKEHLIRELQASLAQTKRLHGLLPICSYCKKIKDDNGAWHQLESYFRSHAEVEFSHGICQECGEKHHPQVFPTKK